VATRRDGEIMFEDFLLVVIQYTNVTNNRTDGRTDTAQRHRPHLCIASRGKNLAPCSTANPREKPHLREIYAHGGGLLVAPMINSPHLLVWAQLASIVSEKGMSCDWQVAVIECTTGTCCTLLYLQCTVIHCQSLLHVIIRGSVLLCTCCLAYRHVAGLLCIPYDLVTSDVFTVSCSLSLSH